MMHWFQTLSKYLFEKEHPKEHHHNLKPNISEVANNNQTTKQTESGDSNIILFWKLCQGFIIKK